MQKISFSKTNARLIEKIAKSFLWLAAGVSIAVLLWIIGSILFQGFVAISDREYPVIASGSSITSFDSERNQKAVFIINNGIRADELTAQDIINFYSLEKTDWVIASQDLDVSLFSFPTKTPIAEAFQKSVLGNSFELAFTAQYVLSGIEMIKQVVSTPGAIGYIDTSIKSTAVAYGAKVIILSEEDTKDISIIVNKDVAVTELSLEHVVEIFLGEERKWKETNADIIPFLYEKDNPMQNAFFAFMREGMFKRSCTIVENDTDMIEIVASTPGAIGYIHENAVDDVKNNADIKILTIRSIALFAHPSVFEIKNYKQLRSINDADVAGIFDGTIINYTDIEGIDLTVVPVLYSSESDLGKDVWNLQFSETFSPRADTIMVDTEEELVTALAGTAGGIGFGNYFSLHQQFQAQVLPVRRQEIGQNLTFEFLIEAPSKSSRAGGVSTIIGNTLFLIIITLIFAVPLGVGAAVYLVEYSKQGILVNILRFFTETLAGIPSIIYGLFGYILFRVVLNMKEGILPAGLTLMIMILPTIIRTTEEALKSVPKSYRMESFALGATMWQTVRRVILPAASPGIVTGIILGVGRAVGETAAVLFTCGSSSRFILDQGVNPEMFTKSARVLALHIFFLFKESAGNVNGIHQAYATSAILIIVILGINLLTAQLLKRMNSMRN